jgi:hypothetical protein
VDLPFLKIQYPVFLSRRIEGLTDCRLRVDLYLLKTTIEIPEVLYKKAKIRAVETGQTLRQIVLTSLKNELETRIEEPAAPYWANRKLRTGFKRLLENGSLSGGTDSTEIISEDRSSRDETIAQ